MLVLSRKRDEQIMIGETIIITVVDIRGAPPPGENRRAAEVAQALGMDTGSAPTTQDPPDLSGLPEGATEEAISKALKPNPAGNIVYYRIN